MSDGSDKVVCYHKECTDGHCAAWLLRLMWPKATFLGFNPGEPKPDDAIISGKDIYVVDMAFKRDDLERMNHIAKSLAVMGHHKTNRDALAGLPYCEFDMGKSGAGLVFRRFKDEIEEAGARRVGDVDVLKSLTGYVEDYDIWRFKFADSREIHAALSSYPFTFEAWDELFFGANNLWFLADEGRALMRYRAQLIDRLVKDAGEKVINGIKVRYVNSPVLQSETCEALYSVKEPVVACCWAMVDRGGKKVYRYSFRSKQGPDSIDVAEIAKLYGGGGHHNSAGATSERFIFE